MRIFMTGGTGFFGKSFFDYLETHERCKWRDAEYVVLSRHPHQSNGRITYVQGDVCDFSFPKGHFDAIVHMASPIQGAMPDAETEEVIRRGASRVLAFANTANVDRLLFTSSGAVYGPSFESNSEEERCRPVTGYGKAKLAAERLFVESGLNVSIARCFAFVGSRLPRNGMFAIGNFIQDCVDNRQIVIKGDGTPMRSYLYADDLVEWLLAILERGVSGRPYNVGSDEGISILDLAKRVRSVVGTKNEIQVLSNLAGARPSVYVPDVSRARDELGLSVRVGLDEAIRLSV